MRSSEISSMLWLFCSILAVAFSPIGKAIADRLAGRVPPPSPINEELTWLTQRMDDRVADLEERLEHAEHLLSEGGRHGTQFAGENDA